MHPTLEPDRLATLAGDPLRSLPQQIELGLPPAPLAARARRERRVMRRAAGATDQRLRISPEAFEAVEGDAVPDRRGLLEAALALLVTLAFGLGWAALELERGESAATGYASAQGIFADPIASSGRPAFGQPGWAEQQAEEERWREAMRVAVRASSKP